MEKQFELNESVAFPGLDELFAEEQPEPVPESRPRIMSLWSRAKIGTLQSRLDGLQMRILRRDRVSNQLIMRLANDVFGFEGWSTKIIHIEAHLDDQTTDPSPDNKDLYSVTAFATIRITLKDGTFYESNGMGKSHNLPDKGLAYRTAKMLAVTLATKSGIMDLPILSLDDEFEFGDALKVENSVY